MNSKLLILLLFFIFNISLNLITFKLNDTNSYSASIFVENDKFIFMPNVYDELNAAAVCKYSPSLEQFGWDFLAISSNIENISLNAVTKSYAMGYLEGIVTKDRIFSHYLNMRAYNWYDFPNKTMPQEVKEFLNDHFNYIDSLISEDHHDEYLRALSIVISQYKGLVDGYNSVTEDSQKLDKIEFLNMAAFGDLEDVPLFNPQGAKMSNFCQGKFYKEI
jgi:hypothetical protein